MLKRVFFLVVLLLSGCASSKHGIGNNDPAKEIIKLGVIESVTPIEMDASSNAGSMAGGIFGQVGGANTGTGRGAVVGSVFGSVLGGTLGHQAGIGSRQGLELWIKLDGAEQSTYAMQPGQPDTFRVGDRVRIVTKKGGTVVELDTHPTSK
jgi:outer membrane lipoprotein SlyB